MESGISTPSNEPQWTEEKLYLNADSFFKNVLKNIHEARTSIDLESYIFQHDDLGKKVVQELCAAAERGVKVRILIDAFSSTSFPQSTIDEFQKKGIELKFYHPFAKVKFIKLFQTFNRRNHRKTWIFDRDRTFVGSANIVKNNWKEIGLSIKGYEVIALINAFEKAWDKKGLLNKLKQKVTSPQPRARALRRPQLVRLNDRLWLRRRNYINFLRKMKHAREHILIGNAYFAPPLRTVRTLCKAAQKGVNIKLLVPQNSDVFFMPWVTSTYYYGLIKAGVKIFEYKPNFYHAKILMIDDYMFVGSSNLNHRSILHDLESDVAVTLEENQHQLYDDFENDLTFSHRVTLNSLKRTTVFKKLIANLMLLFRYWF
ncbi:phosphatidylserine/phosphatidylglycerophosphate/cardiolipin synthase family protein [bacterium]|nr:phosphatidylserine/phosphatidylglycerophosphate/cardiolipin synthase family protein [bacterium]